MEGRRGLAARISTGLSPAKQGRRFGLTVGGAFVALTVVLLWRRHEVAASVTGALGAVLILGAIVVPRWLLPIERAWMAMAHAISKVTTPLILGIVYFLVVAPIGVVMRMLGRNPLLHGVRGGGFWFDRSLEETKRGGLDRQF